MTTIEQILSDVQLINLKKPGKIAEKVLIDNKNKRSISLDLFKVVDKKCCWCNEEDIKPPKRKYCSDDCGNSAFMYSNPCSPMVRGYLLLVRQHGACVGCGEIQQVIIDRYEHWLRSWKAHSIKHLGSDKPSFHFLGDQTGHKINVDHILAFNNGGSGIGLDNVQVLCVDCHLEKTKIDNLIGKQRKGIII